LTGDYTDCTNEEFSVASGWAMSLGSFAYTIIDATSNANHGTKYGSTEATGQVGQAQDFDGTDDYIETSTGIVTAYSYTFEAIAKWISVNGGVLVSVADVSEANVLYGIRIDSDYPNIAARNTSFYSASASNSYTDNQSHYIAGVFSGDTSKTVYGDDGSNTGTLSTSVTMNTNVDVTSIGRFGDSSPGNYFTGIIDEVRISSTARSSAWIAATYDSLWDTLLTYGAEETAPPASDTNVLFIFSNF